MAQATPRVRTPLTVWLGYLSLPPITWWHIKIFFFALGYIVVPILLTGWCNMGGWRAGTVVMVGLTGIFDWLVLTTPWAFAGVSILGYLRGQPGFDKGWSIKDGVDHSWRWIRYFYIGLTITILVRSAYLVALVFLPIKGFEQEFLIALCFSPLLILGALFIIENPGVVKWFVYAYIAIYCLNMASWIAVAVVPSWRQSASVAVIHDLDTAIANQEDKAFQKRVQDIKDKLMKFSGTLEQRIEAAKLSEEERNDLKEARAGKNYRKVYKDTAPVVVDTVSTVTGTVVSVYDRGFNTMFLGKTFDLQVDNLKGKRECFSGLPDGTWDFTAIPVKAFVTYQGRQKTDDLDGFIRANGVASGGKVTVTGGKGCVDFTFLFDDPNYVNNPIQPLAMRVKFEGSFWGTILYGGGLILVLYVIWRVWRRVRGHVPAGH